MILHAWIFGLMIPLNHPSVLRLPLTQTNGWVDFWACAWVPA
jgi:hypothetical protein